MAKRIDRTAEIEGKKKWVVNEMLDKKSNKIGKSGYFGDYTKITYRRKKAIVYVDDRDAEVKVITGWYDEIYFRYDGEDWDGDNRWNNDLPLVVKNNGKYNLTQVHGNKLLVNEWLANVTSHKFYRDRTIGHYLDGTKMDGTKVIVSKNGVITSKEENTPQARETMMNTLKGWSADDAEELWVNKGLPCAYQRGLTYKGACVRPIDNDRAKELIKTHRSFGGMFESLAWEIVDCKIMLVFHDYANSDYD